MSQTPMHISDAADLYDPSIQKMFVKSAGNDPEDYKKYVAVETGVEDYIRKDSSLSGLGEAGRIAPENASIVTESPIQGYDQSYTQVEYGKVMSFTKRMWKFGIKKRDMMKITNELRFACVRKRERLCAERLDNGWSTSYTHTDDKGNYTVTTTGGNAVALYSASQTREDGGTDNNNIIYDGTTYNMDLDYDALKAMHRTASLMKDPKGNQMVLDMDTLIVRKGSNAYFRALEILGAIRKGKIAASAENDGNGLTEYKIVALPRLSNMEYWHALDSSMLNGYEYGIQYLESQPIELEGPNVVFKTNEIQYKSTVMFSLGHNDGRINLGSKATNAS